LNEQCRVFDELILQSRPYSSEPAAMPSVHRRAGIPVAKYNFDSWLVESTMNVCIWNFRLRRTHCEIGFGERTIE